MRILEVHSGNAVGGDSNKYTFVKEQGNAIAKYCAIVDYYAIVGKGVIGYSCSLWFVWCCCFANNEWSTCGYYFP